MPGSPLSGRGQDTNAVRREAAADSPAGPYPSLRVVIFGCQTPLPPPGLSPKILLLFVVTDQITPSNTELAVCLDVLGTDWPFLI